MLFVTEKRESVTHETIRADSHFVMEFTLGAVLDEVVGQPEA